VQEEIKRLIGMGFWARPRVAIRSNTYGLFTETPRGQEAYSMNWTWTPGYVEIIDGLDLRPGPPPENVKRLVTYASVYTNVGVYTVFLKKHTQTCRRT
jgi:hypothetical protein